MSMNVNGNRGQITNTSKWFQNTKVDQTPKRAKDVLPSAEDKSVKVTISKEGKDYYRQKIQTTNGISVDEITEQKEMLSKLGMSAEDGMKTQFHDKLVAKNGALDRGNFDKDQLMGNCLSVYMSMYDEIKQGYENGTREKWIADGDITAGGTYRKLTEEEEIAALDKTFNFYSDVIDGYVNYGIKAGQDVQRAMENTQLQLNNQKKMAEERTQGNQMESIHQRLQQMRDFLKAGYSIDRSNVGELIMQAMKIQ